MTKTISVLLTWCSTPSYKSWDSNGSLVKEQQVRGRIKKVKAGQKGGMEGDEHLAIILLWPNEM